MYKYSHKYFSSAEKKFFLLTLAIPKLCDGQHKRCEGHMRPAGCRLHSPAAEHLDRGEADWKWNKAQFPKRNDLLAAVTINCNV